jgi:phage terminase large subunit-like protein
MCIICNVHTEHNAQSQVDHFLRSFSNAGTAMQSAAKAMHDILPEVIKPEDRQRYDGIHKKMVKIIKEWNNLEHERELQQKGPG